ncbi:MAG TPA: hypothetical protein VGJ92_01110 [Methanocella sp.]|jgi:hypothetical protein
MKRLVRSPEGMELAMLCIDFGYKLTDRPGDLTRTQIHFLAEALSWRAERVSLARSDRQGVNKIVFIDDSDEEEEE